MNGKGNALIAAGEEWLRTYPRKRMIPVIGLLHHARNAVDRNLKSRLTRMKMKMPDPPKNEADKTSWVARAAQAPRVAPSLPITITIQNNRPQNLFTRFGTSSVFA